MKLLYQLTVFAVFILILTIVIAYARGYRIDIGQKSLVPTGILAVSSSPRAAKIYVNGILKGATDTNLTLPPGNYTVEVRKDGYTSFNRKVLLKGEIVMSLDATLFPINPSLSPLTNLGIVKTVLVDQTGKILLFSQNNNPEKDGIYLFDPDKKPLGLNQTIKTIVLAKNLPYSDLDLKNADVDFSPDFSEFILNVNNASYLLSLDSDNKQLFDLGNSKDTLLEAWQKEKEALALKILETFPKEIVKEATDSFRIISFSPDETKIFYLAEKNAALARVLKPPLIGSNQTTDVRELTTGSLYIYDKKEDKNFSLGDLRLDITETKSNGRNTPSIKLTDGKLSTIIWFPDSKHLIVKESTPKKQISIFSYDGSNKQAVYSGPFDSAFYSVTNDGNLVVLANLNPENNTLPDLYLVGIR